MLFTYSNFIPEEKRIHPLVHTTVNNEFKRNTLLLRVDVR